MIYRVIVIVVMFSIFSCTKGRMKSVVIETENYKVTIPLSQGLSNSLEFVKVHSKVLPILRGKEENFVLSWDFEVKNTNIPIYLKELTFDLEGTEDVDDFATFEMEYHNAQESPLQFGSVQQAQVGSILTFKDKVKLVKGKNTFRLKCKLSPTANIRNHLDIRPTAMMIGGKSYEVNIAPIQRKLGIALLQHGQNKVHTYRIPGLVTTNKGTLIAVYDMRRSSDKDLQGDIDVGMSRSTDGGQTWHDADVIIDMGEYGRKPEKLNGVGDPSILYDASTHTIWVAALWTHGMSEKDMAWWGSKEGILPKETGQLVLVKSTNDGKTWSEPYNITSQIKNPKWQLLLQGPGKGIAVGDSLLIFPAQFKEEIAETAIDGGKYTPFSTIIYSKDKGKTWQIGAGAKSNTTEAQVIALNDGTLMLNMRDDRNSKDKGATNGRAVAVTSDLGVTWTPHAASNSALIASNCMASIIKEEFLLEDEKKTLVLFSNPASKTKRVDMSIKISTDDAQTWSPTNTTLIDAGEGRGYSCLTKVDDEHIGILYEGSGADLVFQVFHINELLRE